MTESFSKGFDRGNYGSAYESQDWDSWWAEQCSSIPEDVNREEYEAGMLLGFHSSLEVREIGDDSVAEMVEHLRGVYGEN